MFSRLDCLHVKTKVYKSHSHEDSDKLAKTSEIIEITYEPVIEDFDLNQTQIMLATFDCIFDNLCPACAKRAIEMVDLSVLSTLAGFEEEHKSWDAERLPPNTQFSGRGPANVSLDHKK